mgnify:CR=1 FL=1
MENLCVTYSRSGEIGHCLKDDCFIVSCQESVVEYAVQRLPLLQRDIVGIVASFLNLDDLQSFVRVCKLWFMVGKDVAKGSGSVLSLLTLIMSANFTIFV